MIKLWIFILAVRFSTIVLRYPNYVHPDQYLQGPEIAHYMVFGYDEGFKFRYGYLTWEWTISNPIRSPLFSWVLSQPYRLLKLL